MDLKLGYSVIGNDIPTISYLTKIISRYNVRLLEIYFAGTGALDIAELLKICHDNTVEVFSIHADKGLFDFDKGEIAAKVHMLNEVSNELRCENILFHPRGRNYQENTLFDVCNMLHDKTVLLENTEENIFDIFEKARTINNCEVVIDLSHAAYHNHAMDLIDEDVVKYYHVRGYHDKKYVSLSNSDSKIVDYINKIKLTQNKPLIFEYPYKNIYEFLNDYKKLKSYLEC